MENMVMSIVEVHIKVISAIFSIFFFFFSKATEKPYSASWRSANVSDTPGKDNPFTLCKHLLPWVP